MEKYSIPAGTHIIRIMKGSRRRKQRDIHHYPVKNRVQENGRIQPPASLVIVPEDDSERDQRRNMLWGCVEQGENR